MQKTLSEINDLMNRIGCFSKTQMDKQLHESYLKEMMDDEEYRRGHHHGMRKEMRPDADENTKIEITDSYAILYNASRKDALDSLLQKGTNIEYIGTSAGTYVWGRGIYTNFQRYQAHWRTIDSKDTYGEILIKFKYHGNLLNECLIAEPQLWKEPLSQQIKKFKGLEEFLVKKGVNIAFLDTAAHADGMSSRGLDAIKSACGGGENMAMLLQFGVQGVVFFGKNDRPVAVIYDADKLEILNYVDNTGIHNLNKDLDWKGLKNSEGGRPSNDVTPILSFFKDYEGDIRHSRPQCGQLLLIDKNTNKSTFIDFNRAKEIIANKQWNEDPRLFGDFEFEKAQNFSEVGGKELAYVQLDNDPNSQFYIDKEGYLFKTPNGKPYSHIEEYYPDENTPSNNNIEDFSSFTNDSDFDDFKDLFGESIIKFLKEKILSESRTETTDGHVELDNFDLARKIMKFSNPDDAYFIKIAERHKDHPDRHYEHDACAYKGYFEITSVEHLNAVEPVIKRLCQKGEWRAMMYINPRQMGDTREYAHNVLEPRFKRHNSHMQGHEIEVSYGQSKDWNNRPLCFIDVDNDDPNIHKQVVDYIQKMGIKPLDMYNTTNNGLHIILPDKEEAKKLDFSFLDKGKSLGKWATAGVEIDKSMTLYAYVKAQGYGTQKRMQQRLGGR